MAGRTLGEAWVTIRPDTAGFRAALQAEVKKSMAGFKPNITVTVKLSADSAKLRTELQTAVTAASKGLDAKTNLDVGVNKASLAKSQAEVNAATKRSAASYVTWWEKAIRQKADREDTAAAKTAADYVTWWDKALNQRVLRERAAANKAASDEQNATQKAAASYEQWWNKALNAQDLKSRQVTDSMRNELSGLDTKIEEFKKHLEGIAVTTNDDQSKAELNALQARANVLRTTLGTISTNVGVAKAMAQLAALDVAAARFRAAMAGKGATPGLDLELTLAQSQLAHLGNSAKTLHKDITSALSPGGITIGTVSHDVMDDLKNLRTGVEAISNEAAVLRSKGIVNADDIAKVKTLTSNMSQLSSAVAADGVTVKSTAGSYRGWVNTIISMARVQIPLFNGAFEKMLPHFLAIASGTHIMVEAALEFVAVWVPAAMALGVFAIAATKSTLEVASDVKNMGIAASGTGQQFEGMAKKVGTSMSSIAKPYVFEAYGLGLIALQKQSQTTAGVIQSVGGSIDKWISEAVLAYQKGTGQMAKKGASDFALLGDSFKQLGTLIQGFIKITPGYAHDLLMLGDTVLHVASAILNSGIAQGFGKIFLAAHGAFFYLGLFATLGSKLGASLLSPLARISGLSRALSVLGVSASGTKGKMAELGSSIATGWQQGTGKLASAVDKTGQDIEKGLAVAFTSNGPITAVNKLSSELKTGLETGVSTAVQGAGGKFSTFESIASNAMTGLGGKVATAAKGIKGALSGLLSGLGLNPWLLGIAAVGVGLYLLISKFHGATNAAQQFGSAASSALSSSSLQNFGTNLKIQAAAAQQGLAGTKQTVANYASSLSNLKEATGKTGANMGTLGYKIHDTAEQMSGAQQAVGQWQATLDDLNGKNHTFQSNLNLIAKTAGVDLPTAMNMAQQAGISTSHMMSDQGVAAQEDALQVAGLVRGYASLVNGVGGVNTAYQAMNVQNSQILKNAQNVAGAFAGYTTLITGGANAFDTFVQGQTSLNKNMSATGNIASTVTLRLGKFSDKIAVTGKGLDGLTPASIAANQAFLQQVNNSQALYGSLLQLAAASGNTKVAQNNLSLAGKDMVSTLIKTAGGSKAAQQQIYSLAQTFGYTGKDTLPALVKWLGFTGDRTTDLQKRMNGLTAGAGNLQRASKALSGELNSQLSAALSKSIIDAEGGQAAFDKLAGAVRRFASKSDANNMNAVIKQGKSMKQVFISAAGSAAAAEPVMTNYFMTLGVKNQAMAKKMADQILGIGSAASHIEKPIAVNRSMFVGWAKDVNASTGAAGELWNKLAKNDFNPLSGNVDNNKKHFESWAGQMGINKTKADDLWKQLLDNKLQTVNSQVDGNKKKFIDLMVKMGETKGAAANLWAELQKAPKVNAKVNVAASTSGQIAAVASAPGASKQTIGRLFFSAQAHGMATGGKVPGFWNTGDNVMATSPGGPIALQGGEAIVPKALATHPEFTNFAKKRGIPGFSSGGLVGTDNLVNMTNNWPGYKAEVANAGINHAGEAMKANTNAAYNALLSAYGGTGGSATGQAILMDAEKFKGHRYVWGGPSNPQSGWDCSSFAGYILGHDFHMKLPGGASWNGGAHGPVASQYNSMPGFHLASHNVNQIQAGDLLVENSGGHVGFGVGPNRMFSAYGTAVGTIFSDAANMTNIYRMGGGVAAGGGMKGLTTKSPFINTMAKDIDKVYDQSSVIKAIFAQLNATYSGNPTGGAPVTGLNGITTVPRYSPNAPNNINVIGGYLLSHGLNKIGAAGILGNIARESGGDPENTDSPANYGGLIGWSSGNHPPGQGSRTGNANVDMGFQLPGVIDYGNANGAPVSSLNRASNPAAAADIFLGAERAGVQAKGDREAAAMASFALGFAKGGKVKLSPATAKLDKELAKLKKEHDQYVKDYHVHQALFKHDKSKAAKLHQAALMDKYLKDIGAVDTQYAYAKSAKFTMPKPGNQVGKLAERLAAPPWVDRLTSGPGSVTPLGWAMQPALGDLMIAKAMGTNQWLGKATIDPQASSVMANWVAAMQSIGGFLNGATGVNAVQLAGKATGIHGRQTGGPRKSFLTGGTIRENVLGVGPSGDTYKFHSGDKVTGPAVAATQAAAGGLSQEDRMILIGLLQEAKKGNQIAAQQGREVARAMNGNAARKIGRP